MRLLFVMDKKDYGDCTRRFTRNSARSIILRDRKVMMIFSRKYGYYKFPGGGIEAGESPVQVMIRDTREAIRINRSVKDSPYNPLMFQREARVLEMLMEEGLIGG